MIVDRRLICRGGDRIRAAVRPRDFNLNSYDATGMNTMPSRTIDVPVSLAAS
jgi:hypothetical protein